MLGLVLQKLLAFSSDKKTTPLLEFQHFQKKLEELRASLLAAKSR